jgi:hypothetical protein
MLVDCGGRLVRSIALTLLLPALVPPALHAQTAAAVKQMAHARVKLGEQMAADPQLRKAVAAKNAEQETPATREARDREWTLNLASALRKTLSGNPCAQRLRELIAPDPLVVEAILMDAQGANVCVSRETSDYWQGDEPKWRKPFVEGRAAFVDEPAFDQSSATYAVQLSVPVSENAKPIGALTLTLKVRKDAVAPPR